MERVDFRACSYQRIDHAWHQAVELVVSLTRQPKHQIRVAVLEKKNDEVNERNESLKTVKNRPRKDSTDSASKKNYVGISTDRVLPKFDEGSDSRIVENPEMLTDLNMELPDRFRGMMWVRAYDFMAHGASLRMLYQKAAGHHETLMIMQTRDGEIFGAFTTEEWVMTRPREYYGTGESFVFKYRGKELDVFRWSGKNDFIQNSSTTHIGVGAGPKGFCFALDEFLDRGTSAPSETFGLEQPLLASEEFRVAELELYCFVPHSRRGSSFDGYVGGAGTANSLFRQNSTGPMRL